MIAILFIVVLTPVWLYLALQVPSFQDWGAREISRTLSEELKTEVNIEKVYFLPFNKVILKKIHILSSPTDTMLSCGKLSVGFSALDLIKSKLTVKNISLYSGYINIYNETDSTTNLSRIFNFTKEPKDTTSKGLDLPDITIRDIKFSNVRFSYRNPFSPDYEISSQGAIKFSDLELKKSDIKVSHFKIEKDTITAKIENISFEERSGFRLKKLSADLKFSNRGIEFRDAILDDGNTFLTTNRLSLLYEDIGDFSDFFNRVKLDIDFDNALLDFRTVSRFVPALKDNKLAVYIDGKIVGPISNISTESVSISSATGLSQIDLKARISGLPDIDQAMMFLDVTNCVTTTLDLAHIISSLNNGEEIQGFKEISPLIRYHFSGRLAGLLDDFVANGTLTTNIGAVYMDMLMKQHPKIAGGMFLKGRVDVKDLNIGALLLNDKIGELSLHSNLSAELLDKNHGNSKFYVDSINITKLVFNNYTYNNIKGKGDFKNDIFNGRIVCVDPNLNFLFQGVVSTKKALKEINYDFNLDLKQANLTDLNIYGKDSISSLSFKTSAKFKTGAKGEIVGEFVLRDLNFKNQFGVDSIGDVRVESNFSDSDGYDINLTSPFMIANYKGTEFIDKFLEKMLGATLHRHLPNLISEKIDSIKTAGRYSIEAHLYDTKPILGLVMPGLFIAKNSSLQLSIGSNDEISGKLSSNLIGYKNDYVIKPSILLSNRDSTLKASLSCERIIVSDMEIDNNQLSLAIAKNQISLNYNFDNSSARFKNSLSLSSDIFIRRDDSTSKAAIYDIKINPSTLSIDDKIWVFNNSLLSIADSTYTIENFGISSNDQYLSATGVLSTNPDDSLTIRLNDFDLTPLNLLFKESMQLAGKLTGDAVVKNIFHVPYIEANITGRDMGLYGKSLGDLSLSSFWNAPKRQLDIDVSASKESHKMMTVLGYFKPDDNFIDIVATLDKMPVIYIEPFIKDIARGLSGDLSGKIYASGPSDKLAVVSERLDFNSVGLTIDFTNVPYTLGGYASLNENGAYLGNLIIKDRFGKQGKISGGVKYNYLKDPELGIKIDFKNIEALNIKPSDNAVFYGNAFGTGYLKLSGNTDKMLLDISILTEPNSSILLPLSSGASAGASDLLTFKAPPIFEVEDEFQFIRKKHKAIINKKASEFIIDIKSNITPDAELSLEIDKSGNALRAYGKGLVALNVNPSKDIFKMYGDYMITSGDFRFMLQGMISRTFLLQEGGTINFNGDIAKTFLNMSAIYKARTAIGTLISDTTSTGSRRAVNCIININGDMTNPKIGFDIEIPDLDPITKSKVNAALNTEDKVLRQSMSLLVSGGFVPDIQSSIVNNTNLLYSNMMDVFSNQLNNIFTQLDIPLGLSLNYQPGQNGNNVFDAAVSAQLFNNRVILNGNLGSSRLNNRDDIVGDFDVEVKIDKSGRFRFKAFSKSADSYSNYLDNTQRHGVGVVFQDEFDSFGEFFRKIFRIDRDTSKSVNKQSN